MQEGCRVYGELSSPIPPFSSLPFPWSLGAQTLASRHTFAICPCKAVTWAVFNTFHFCELIFNDAMSTVDLPPVQGQSSSCLHSHPTAWQPLPRTVFLSPFSESSVPWPFMPHNLREALERGPLRGLGAALSLQPPAPEMHRCAGPGYGLVPPSLPGLAGGSPCSPSSTEQGAQSPHPTVGCPEPTSWWMQWAFSVQE